jgi:hypothetical protein
MVAIGSAVCLGLSNGDLSTQAQGYSEAEGYNSPYSVKLPWSTEDLIPDLLKGPRGEAHEESDTPFREWNSPSLKKKLGSWGPRPRKYSPPEHAKGKSEDWQRARVIATALRYQGYAYRHHHIPDWNPPEGYHTPEKGETQHAGKGLDCSNFTSFIYNQGLGISLNSDIHKQAEITEAPIHGSGRTIRIKTIPGQGSVEDLVPLAVALTEASSVQRRPHLSVSTTTSRLGLESETPSPRPDAWYRGAGDS